MEKNRIKAVVIGGSSGSLDVLLKLFPALNPAIPLTIIVVLHRKNAPDSPLANLLSYKTSIPVKEVEDKDAVLPGMIYLAPADYHLLIERDFLFSLDSSEKVNYSRPSLDVTFESAADVYGPTLVGILLSGANSDGTAGLDAIKRAGGIIIAQSPETAKVAFMPEQAIQHTDIDFVFDSDEMAAFINGLR
ncbi:chemotaxis protein CheB [Tellurirhabdus bombi]|uniref:chemotaxis protein CheB n=1 Tax=Tellurirhabdus bombi TaxID=2907205 RepID=UPI001F318E77|nr:chemotaxis protein CheB [Tellurirhabdus bombi]